jgi:hypothetical protein
MRFEVFQGFSSIRFGSVGQIFDQFVQDFFPHFFLKCSYFDLDSTLEEEFWCFQILGR